MSIFLFYILCEIVDNEYHIAAYFSKVNRDISRSNKPRTISAASSPFLSIKEKDMASFSSLSAMN